MQNRLLFIVVFILSFLSYHYSMVKLFVCLDSSLLVPSADTALPETWTLLTLDDRPREKSTEENDYRAILQFIARKLTSIFHEIWLRYACVLRSRWINSKRTSAVWSEVECLVRCYKSKFMSNEWRDREREQQLFILSHWKIWYTSWHCNFDNFTREVR